jgi:hypothetical protein
MKFEGMIVVTAIALLSSSATYAVTDRFTATSASFGTLGHLDIDSSVFDGTSSQFVNNTFLIDIDFTDPQSAFHVVTPGPASDGTWFDSTGALPIVVGGGGFTGGTDFSNGVWIASTNYVALAGNSYDDVTWITSVVPEPETYAMLLAGLGLLGFMARRRKESAV